MSPSLDSSALAIRRRRAPMACRNCRKRKIKCVTNEDPPHNPCERCTRKGLHCEYVAVGDETPPSSPNGPPPNSPPHSTTGQAYYGLHSQQHQQSHASLYPTTHSGLPSIPRSLNPTWNSPSMSYGVDMPANYSYSGTPSQTQAWPQTYNSSSYPSPFHAQTSYPGYSQPQPPGTIPGQTYQPAMYGHNQRTYCVCNGPCICGRGVQG
ncbi:hypothetical protein E1B28_004449 [Marasmius oreades]|uniref:Zn(2)-C6 fungal-type domain-containing protein n=1 Tax=Marasmius oreades TaxID=181124 RepID=A0A9P8ACT7_9AGAR|nr:uncharacterized protein E1B28_004449 [Marasmius oreades]KAG7097061.1 hypothetical protein E1B28_004449 [Marasmius oreades]